MGREYIELVPALQQADALPSELHPTELAAALKIALKIFKLF
jgi:hypothetical protein